MQVAASGRKWPIWVAPDGILRARSLVKAWAAYEAGRGAIVEGDEDEDNVYYEREEELDESQCHEVIEETADGEDVEDAMLAKGKGKRKTKRKSKSKNKSKQPGTRQGLVHHQ